MKPWGNQSNSNELIYKHFIHIGFKHSYFEFANIIHNHYFRNLSLLQLIGLEQGLIRFFMLLGCERHESLRIYFECSNLYSSWMCYPSPGCCISIADSIFEEFTKSSCWNCYYRQKFILMKSENLTNSKLDMTNQLCLNCLD